MNLLSRPAARIEKAVRTYGIWGSVSLVIKVQYRRIGYKIEDWRFDRKWGVETGGRVNPQGRADLVPYALQYQPAPPALFRSMLEHLPIDFTRFRFCDLGCGKGRALMLAAERPFKAIVGVEFSPSLVETANRNVSRFASRMAIGGRISVICGDAAEYEFAQEPTVVYLFNPFEGPVMDKVIDNISLLASTSECYVAYVNPVHDSALGDPRRFTRLWNDRQCSIYRVMQAS